MVPPSPDIAEQWTPQRTVPMGTLGPGLGHIQMWCFVGLKACSDSEVETGSCVPLIYKVRSQLLEVLL